MSTMRRCIDGGYLVGMEGWLPTEQAYYRWSQRYPRTGCNHLKCTACGGVVAVWDALGTVAGVAVDIGALLAGNAPNQPEALIRDGSSRLYACGCQAYSESSTRALQPGDGADHPSRSLPWRCAGHMPLDLPAELDGEVLASDTMLQTAMGALAGTAPKAGKPWPPLSRPDGMPADWLATLYAIVHPGEVRAAIGAAATEALGDRSIAIRAAALDFYLFHPGARGAETIAHRLRDTPEQFVDVPLPWWPDDDLASLAWGVLVRRLHLTAPGCGADELAAVALGKEQLLAAGRGNGAVLLRLGKLDSDWVRDNATAIIVANPEMLATLVGVIKRWTAADAVSVVASLVAGEGVDASEVQRLLVKRLHGATRIEVLASQGWG